MYVNFLQEPSFRIIKEQYNSGIKNEARIGNML